tara:strand:- start:1748 stop:2974 length:1227 start_codon:yes stop_codon:yes gene_type:complete
MDTILRNVTITSNIDNQLVDIGIADGKIEAIQTNLTADGQEIDLKGCMVTPGFIETHIHLDKSCILERCHSDKGDLEEAIREGAKAKSEFTAEDVYDRGKRTLDKCLVNGTTHMRTHLEVDPVIGLTGLEGIRTLISDYKWAMDIEICVFPQEGLLNNPGTDELMVAALNNGATVVGGAPYTDSNPHGQIDRLFELAREFDTDIDMHLDFGSDPTELDLDYVCSLTEQFDYGGRVTIGHVTKLSAVSTTKLQEVAKTLATAGVALTVLPSTDLFLMGRHQDHSVMRGVTPAHKLLGEGVNCSLSTNNVLNPFTPFGDCSLVRMANLYANTAQIGQREEIIECFRMITTRAAKLLRLNDYGLIEGNSADLVILNCADRATAIAELAQPLYGFKRGRLTFSHSAAHINFP